MANLTLDLYRSCKRNKVKQPQIVETFAETKGRGSLYPDYEGFTRKNGTFRRPDVTTYPYSGETWVRGVQDTDANGRHLVPPDQGVSVSSEPGKFGYSLWYYFLMPKGTEIPPAFDVKQTGSDPSHYSIRCRIGMSQTAYQGALDNFARSAIAKSVELARATLYFEQGA